MDEPSTSKWDTYCCNPEKKEKHYSHKKNLRTVTQTMASQNNSLIIGTKICDSCRKRIAKVPDAEPTKNSSSTEEESEIGMPMDVHDSCASVSDVISTPEKDEALEAFNKSLVCLDETPIRKKRLIEKNYPEDKIKAATDAFRTKMLNLSPNIETNIPTPSEEMLNQLKEKFNSTVNRSIKMQILTTLPKSWSTKKIENEFQVSNFTARKAKQLVKEKGIMSSPDPRPGKTLNIETAQLIRDFYESDEVSRQMPGKKDFVSVKIQGKREQVQKKLILSNLREAFTLFKERHPNHKVCFSKFCELRPKHCVLAGASGTHSVCVCLIHQNVKLMLIPCNLPDLTECSKPLKSYKDVMKNLMCENALTPCFFGECNNCPDPIELKEHFETCFDNNGIEHVTYKQWMKVEKRTTLETLTKSADEFLNSLFEKLPALLRHSFIATQQSAALRHTKDNLKEDQYLIICDFSENYSFLLQDAVQGFHWNNAQATLHPFVIYYKSQENKLEHTSLVVISDCLIHDTIAVHLFQRLLVDFLKSQFKKMPQYMFYFSDGAAAQYKNKLNFLNLCMHKEDFNINAAWHFFATSHGKNACDGVGGTVKRLAAKASLCHVYANQIMTPRQLYDWSKVHINSVNFIYATNQQYEEEKIYLLERISQAKPISGTQKLHTFIPINDKKICVKPYTFSENTREERVTIDSDVDFESMVGFITCQYNEHWWLGCVLASNEDTQEIKVSFLHPHGPSPSYKYPAAPDILQVLKMDVLTKVDPVTPTGRVYILTDKETMAANKKLELKKK